MNKTLEEKNGIDFAIEQCRESIYRNSKKSIFFLVLMFMWPLLGGGYFTYNTIENNSIRTLLLNLIKEAKNSGATIEGYTSTFSDNTVNSDYLIFVLLVIIFGFFASFYRFHLKEIAKYEYYLLGFMRIRIAANNSEQKFDTEVRKSLTDGAFSYETKDTFFKKGKGIENPLPGHIGLDLSSAIINKIIDGIEIIPKKETK